MKQKNFSLEQIINRIQTEPLEKLTDVAYLEYKLLPELGLNDRHIHQYPTHLHPYCGIGIDSWQYPNQFSKYLYFLSQQKISNYVEIGCHKGGTFIITLEYLSRFNKITSAIGVDNWPREIIQDYIKHRPQVKYITTSSQDADFKELFKQQPWDLVLVDGDHSYKAATEDWLLVRNNTRFVAFHDIVNGFCPGTQLIWQDIKSQYNTASLHAWTEQYDEVLLRCRSSIMGIGLVRVK